MNKADLYAIVSTCISEEQERAIHAHADDLGVTEHLVRETIRAGVYILWDYSRRQDTECEASIEGLFFLAKSNEHSRAQLNQLFSKEFPPVLRAYFLSFLRTPSDLKGINALLSLLDTANLYVFLNEHYSSIERLLNNPIMQQQFALGFVDPNLFLFAAATDKERQKRFELLLNYPLCSAYSLNPSGYTLELVIASSSLDPALKALRIEQVRQKKVLEDRIPTNYWALNLKKLTEKGSASSIELAELTGDLPAWDVSHSPIDKSQIKKFYQLLAWLENNPPFSAEELLTRYKAGLRLLSRNKAFRTQASFPEVLSCLELFACALGEHLKEADKIGAVNEAELSALILTGMEQLGYCAQGVVSYFTSATMALNSKMKLTHAINMAIDKKAPVLFRMLGIPETMQVHFGKDRLMRLMGINTTVDYDAYRVMLSKGLVQSFANKITSELILEDTLVTDSLPILDTPALILELTRGEQAIYLGQIRTTLERDWLTLQRAGLCIKPLASSDEQCREVLETITGLAPEAITDLLVHSDDTTYPKDAFNLKEQALLEGELEQKYRQVLREQEIYSHSPATVTALKEQIWSLLTKHPSLYEPSETKLWQQLIESPNGLYFFKATVEAHADEAGVISEEHFTYIPPTAKHNLLEALLASPFLTEWFFGMHVALNPDESSSEHVAFPVGTSHFRDLEDTFFSVEHRERERWFERFQMQPGSLHFIFCLMETRNRSLFGAERLPLYREMVRYLRTNTGKKYDSLLPVLYDMSHSRNAAVREAAQSVIALNCRKQKALQLWDTYWITACYLDNPAPEFIDLNELGQIRSLLDPSLARAALFLHKDNAHFEHQLREACTRLGAEKLYDSIHRQLIEFGRVAAHELTEVEAIDSAAAGAGAATPAPVDALALHWAAYRGDSATTEALLALGSTDINAGIGDLQLTPLQIAASKGHYPLVKQLLARGARIPNCTKLLRTKEGSTIALVCAELSKEEGYHALLLEHHRPTELLPLMHQHKALEIMLTHLVANPTIDPIFARAETVSALLTHRPNHAGINALLMRLLTNSSYDLAFASREGIEWLSRASEAMDLSIKERALWSLAQLVFVDVINEAHARILVPKFIATYTLIPPHLKEPLLYILAAMPNKMVLDFFLTTEDALPLTVRGLSSDDINIKRHASKALASLVQNPNICATPSVIAALPLLITSLDGEDVLFVRHTTAALAPVVLRAILNEMHIPDDLTISLTRLLNARDLKTQHGALRTLSILSAQETALRLMIAHTIIPRLIHFLKQDELCDFAAVICSQIARREELRYLFRDNPRAILRLRGLLESETPHLDAADTLAHLQDDESFASRNGISNLVFLYQRNRSLAEPLVLRVLTDPLSNSEWFITLVDALIKKVRTELFTEALFSRLLSLYRADVGRMQATLQNAVEWMMTIPESKAIFGTREGLVVLATNANFGLRNPSAQLLISFIQENSGNYHLFSSPMVVQTLADAFADRNLRDCSAHLQTIFIALYEDERYRSCFTEGYNINPIMVLLRSEHIPARSGAINMLYAMVLSHQHHRPEASFDLAPIVHFLYQMLYDDLEPLTSLRVLAIATRSRKDSLAFLPPARAVTTIHSMLAHSDPAIKALACEVLGNVLPLTDTHGYFSTFTGIICLCSLLDSPHQIIAVEKLYRVARCKDQFGYLQSSGGIPKVMALLNSEHFAVRDRANSILQPIFFSKGEYDQLFYSLEGLESLSCVCQQPGYQGEVLPIMRRLATSPPMHRIWATEEAFTILCDLLDKSPFCATIILNDLIYANSSITARLLSSTILTKLLTILRNGSLDPTLKLTAANNLYLLGKINPAIYEHMADLALDVTVIPPMSPLSAEATVPLGAAGAGSGSSPGLVGIPSTQLEHMLESSLAWHSVCALCIIAKQLTSDASQVILDSSSLLSKLFHLSKNESLAIELRRAAMEIGFAAGQANLRRGQKPRAIECPVASVLATGEKPRVSDGGIASFWGRGVTTGDSTVTESGAAAAPQTKPPTS